MTRQFVTMQPVQYLRHHCSGYEEGPGASSARISFVLVGLTNPLFDGPGECPINAGRRHDAILFICEIKGRKLAREGISFNILGTGSESKRVIEMVKEQ